MSVKLWIGQTTSPANVVNKTISGMTPGGTSGEFNCELKQPCDVTHPVFLIGADTESAIHKLDNYCYCQEFGRYYFCEITLSPQGYVVSCTCDPLMSFKNSIVGANNSGGLNCVIARNENEAQNMIMDNSYVTGAQDTVWFKNFESDSMTPWMTRAVDSDIGETDISRRYLLITSA